MDNNADEELGLAVTHLYSAFHRYRLNYGMRACPCCVTREDIERLLKKGRQADPDELEKFAFKAMSTWGDSDDFRYFLPRIFELQVSATPMKIDDELVFGKLKLADYRSWRKEEQSAVEQFLVAWGHQILSKYPAKAISSYLCVLAMVTNDLEAFLKFWRENSSQTSLRHLAAISEEYVYSPNMFRRIWWEETPEASGQIETWLRDPATEAQLTEAYFRFESEPFAEEFARAADALGWIRK